MVKEVLHIPLTQRREHRDILPYVMNADKRRWISVCFGTNWCVRGWQYESSHRKAWW